MKTQNQLLLTALFLFAFSPNAFSNGTSYGGYISHIATANGAILFRVTGGTQSNRPACATSGRFGVSASSEHYPVILMAFEMGMDITLGGVAGLGTCGVGHGAEDLKWIEVYRN